MKGFISLIIGLWGLKGWVYPRFWVIMWQLCAPGYWARALVSAAAVVQQPDAGFDASRMNAELSFHLTNFLGMGWHGWIQTRCDEKFGRIGFIACLFSEKSSPAVGCSCICKYPEGRLDVLRR